jgi:hypothetical protein
MMGVITKDLWLDVSAVRLIAGVLLGAMVHARPAEGVTGSSFCRRYMARDDLVLIHLILRNFSHAD